ncbi:hypothetical protein KKI93_16660 [Xenorhabdus bovienii]|uniref:hypothetical protein n=1 Tax=Xenorhabdus bovienii TaxID=40576 RepID=UPI0023B24533|nr:hypothetical protein [Xenorhabdus bovienii]MDE9565655.1 hypothetical protein [Xenorhabdus bovienii]
MASLSPFWDFFDLAINQIAKTGLSSLQVIYYFESLFTLLKVNLHDKRRAPVYAVTEKVW